jgi:hypothetical protein
MKRLILCSLLCLTACSAHKVRCDARLVPINPPSANAGGSAARRVEAAPR